MVFLCLGPLGCDALFDVERHDLGPFRIAAISAADGEARAAIWSGEGLYHEASPRLVWTLDGEWLGEGWGVSVPAAGALGLTATAPDGAVESATVRVGDSPPSIALTRGAASLGEDLSLDARRAVEADPVEDAVPAGDAARLDLGAGAGVARWMSAAGVGSVLELEARVADVLPEELTWDGGELEDRAPVDEALLHQLALVIDDQGNNDWLWVDAAFGDEGPWLRHAGRLLRGSAPAGHSAGGLVAATLVDDASLAGIALADLTAVDDLSGQERLACAPEGVPFELAWIAEGRCPRPEILGARVVLLVE